MRNFTYLLAILFFTLACEPNAGPTKQTVANHAEAVALVDSVLNDWHRAAAEANFTRYFSYFASDSSIFIGTDATERWTVAQFKPWSKPYFDRGTAWAFTAEKRVVYLSDEGTTAWFDEELATPNMGPCRGSGVLSMTPNGWRIAHYNLSVPIPNLIVNNVVEQIDSVLHKN